MTEIVTERAKGMTTRAMCEVIMSELNIMAVSTEIGTAETDAGTSPLFAVFDGQNFFFRCGNETSPPSELAEKTLRSALVRA